MGAVEVDDEEAVLDLVVVAVVLVAVEVFVVETVEVVREAVAVVDTLLWEDAVEDCVVELEVGTVVEFVVVTGEVEIDVDWLPSPRAK